MYIVTNLNDIGDKSTWRWLQIQMNWLSFAAPLTCRLKLPVTRTVEKYYKSKSKRVTISNDNASNSSFNFFQTICADSLPYICRQFVASVFGHQLVVSKHDYLLLLEVTSLECIVTITTNNSYCFLDRICAVHLEVSCQFLASAFGIHL